MTPDVSGGPTGLAVRRQFEPNRLAEDCQTRAYEQVLAVVDQAELTCQPGNQAEMSGTLVSQEGVAA